MTPAAPPRRFERGNRLPAIAADSQARFAIGKHPFPAEISVRWIAIESIPPATAAGWADPRCKPDDIALLQYTSGSTASPRGVMVTHANLIANAHAIAEGFRHPPRVWGVTWLPPYHDMGLIGGILQPIWFDGPSAVISPLDFVRRPRLWLDAISRYRARTCGGPNFAYNLCARAISRQESSDLRLDCWELAFVGAEPVRATTLDRFADAFAHTGFRREFFFPCYGLAEATLYATGGRPRTLHVSARALRNHRAICAPANNPDSAPLVSCGAPASTIRVLIAAPSTHLPLPDDCVGEILVSGPAIARGYRNHPEDTRQVFCPSEAGIVLHTGDLGFMHAGELYVTGRLKDLIIVRGRNHYAQDIENTVSAVAQPHGAARCAAFSIETEEEERLFILLEVPRQRKTSPDVLAGDVRQAVAAAHELRVSKLVLMRIGSIPVTSSGKVKRAECREQYRSGALEAEAEL
jgi:acyl-CoA synthetase (AMP-forming)/AMP-acid ligase II